MDLAAFLLTFGLAARLTRLATTDRITAPIRDRLADTLSGYFFECPWCVGLWISAATVIAYILVPWPVYSLIAAIFTINLVWCLLARWLDPAHPDPDAEPQPRARGARITTSI